jgi:N-acetylglutamate synthase-like GNAT family acetyltransferase
MNKKIFIRRAIKSDLKRIQHIIYSCIDFVKEKKVLKDKLRKDYTLENLEKALNNTEMFVIEYNKKIVGMGRIEKTSEIRMIYIDPKYHLKGFGRKIIKKIESLAKRKKLKKVYVRALFSAIGFYKKMGYYGRNDKELLTYKMIKQLR